MKKLAGKIAVVTGAGTRLGRALALALGEDGCSVLVHYHSNEAGAFETAAAIERLGGRAAIEQADFELPEGPKKLAETCLSRFGGVDILVNSASYWATPDALAGKFGLFEETLENWERTVAVNARAPFFLIQELGKPLSDRGGSIINILDSSANEPFNCRASHSISKAMLASVTRLAASELAPRVRVNALELGAMLPSEALPVREVAKREWGGVEPAIQGLRFLLENSFVNGEIVKIRGSKHMQAKD